MLQYDSCNNKTACVACALAGQYTAPQKWDAIPLTVFGLDDGAIFPSFVRFFFSENQALLTLEIEQYSHAQTSVTLVNVTVNEMDVQIDTLLLLSATIVEAKIQADKISIQKSVLGGKDADSVQLLGTQVFVETSSLTADEITLSESHFLNTTITASTKLKTQGSKSRKVAKKNDCKF